MDLKRFSNLKYICIFVNGPQEVFRGVDKVGGIVSNGDSYIILLENIWFGILVKLSHPQHKLCSRKFKAEMFKAC